MSAPTAHLVLADGTIFVGEAIGAPVGISTGELTVSTSPTGYQETIAAPASAGRIIVFSTPHIGNQGVLPDAEGRPDPTCHGVVMRELSRRHSNWRSVGDLQNWLLRHDLGGIAEIDTRRLVRHLHRTGPMIGAFGTAEPDSLHAAAIPDRPEARP